MKRPSFQFYPADWSANSNLRRCTHEEKGIWIDVMCLLHDQEEYGVARWPLKEIAQAVGTPVAKIKSLVSKGVLKGADAGQQCDAWIFTPTGAGRKKGNPVILIPEQDGPVWFSSRMVEDEYKRVIRGEYGNAPKTTPDSAPKAPIGATPKTAPDHAPLRAGASSSSSSSSSPSVNQEAIASGVNSTVVATEAEKRLAPDSGQLSPVARVCLGLKAMGYSDTSPHDAKLKALLDAGMSVDEILAAGSDGRGKGKGFRWVLATAEGRRRDAANISPLPPKPTAGSKTAEAAARWLESQGVKP